MTARRLLLGMMFCFVALAFAGCTQYVQIPYSFPPEEYIPPHIKNIAIATPKDFPGKPGSGEQAKLEISQQLRKAEGKPFTIVDRDEVERLINEKDFMQSDFADTSAGATQKLAGVDAFIVGRVTAVEKNETTGREQVPVTKYRTVRYRDSSGKWRTRSESYTEHVWKTWIRASGQYGCAFKLVDVGKGIVVAEAAPTKTFDTGKKFDGTPNAEALLDNSRKMAIHDFVKQIAPHIEMKRYPLATAGGNGCKMLQDRMYAQAAAAFEAEIQAKPDNHAAYYGLALAQVAMRQYPKAMENAQKAYSMNTASQYAQLSNDIKAVMAAWAKNEAQKNKK